VVDTYTGFLRAVGGVWDPPRYHRIARLPFIPTEQEIDQLIVGCKDKTAMFLQLLKETGMRAGEAWGLRWVDRLHQQDGVNHTNETKQSENAENL